MRKRKLQSSVDLGQRIIAMPAFVLETPRHRSVYPVLLENVSFRTKPNFDLDQSDDRSRLVRKTLECGWNV